MKRLIASIFESPHRRYLCAFIILYLLFQSPLIISGLLRPVIINILTKSAYKSGVTLEISDSSFNFPRSLILSHVHLKSHNRLTPPLHLDRLEITLKSYYPIEIHLSNDLLNGNIQCDVKPNTQLLNSLAASCILSRIDLSSYAPLYAAGIKGLLDGTFKGKFSAIDTSLNDADFSLGLSDGYFDAISRGLFDNPSAPISRLIKLPPITDIQIQANGNIKGINLRLDSADILSSMGSVTNIKGALEMEGADKSTPPQLISSELALDIQGNLKLTDLGIKHIGPWLTLKSPNQAAVSELMKLHLTKSQNGSLDLNIMR